MEAKGVRDITEIIVRIERNAMTVSSQIRKEICVRPYYNFIMSLQLVTLRSMNFMEITFKNAIHTAQKTHCVFVKGDKLVNGLERNNPCLF
jgi:hypothetical protein